ncbi:hypothetical protein P7K49_013365, partial [Saguinus oedipus]
NSKLRQEPRDVCTELMTDTPGGLQGVCANIGHERPSCFTPFETLDCDSKLKNKTITACVPQSNTTAVKAADADIFHPPEINPQSEEGCDISKVGVSGVKRESSGTF